MDLKYTAKLRTVGGSVMVAIPPQMLEALQLRPNTEVGISLNGTGLFIEPKPVSKRIGLAARLAKCDFSVPESPEEREWLDVRPQGREVI
jgi:antitoxin ChpS